MFNLLFKMFQIRIPVVAMVSVVLLTACMGTPIASSNSTSLITTIEDIATGPLQTRAVVLEHEGKPAILYSTKSDRVAFQFGEQRRLLDETARVQRGGSYFQLHKNDNALQAFWWSHEDGKNVYFTSSLDGGTSFQPVSMVNNDHGVLPPLSILTGAGGVLGMSYHDERLPGYEIFFNRSTDNGRTWLTPDQRLDTPPPAGKASVVHEPQTVTVGSVWIAAWTDNVQEDGKASYRIVSRHSSDKGLSWSAAEVLYNSEYHISSLAVRAKGDVAVIAADELSRGIFALSTQNQGKSWQKAGLLDGTKTVTNSALSMTLTERRAHLVWIQEREGTKSQIIRGSLDTDSGKWLSRSHRVDTKNVENTKSISPEIVATSNADLVIAWVDYRDIRPNIYLSSSTDQGSTWSEPQALLQPGVLSAGWPQLLQWGTGAAIAYEVYPTESVTKGKLLVQTLPTANSLSGMAGLARQPRASEDERQEKLKQRINSLWGARVAGNYESAYDIFDFAYKASTPRKSYLENVGVINYLEFSPVNIEISGNEANVGMKVKYEVKPVILPSTGKSITVKPVEVELPTKWVWVGSDWYLVYTPSFDPPALKY